MERLPSHALSLKQPWATLLVHGRKSIEVRNWSTPRRERVLIHAARIPDERPEAWTFVPRELHEHAQLLGGVIGSAELVDCLTYDSLETFAVDQAKHFNHLSWFRGPVLYGFLFRDAMPLPFQPCPGWMRFFRVEPMKARRR